MNLPSTTLASNPVALSSIARTSTSVTPRCSMRNSAWPVNERSQFHQSGKVGIEAWSGRIVAPRHPLTSTTKSAANARESFRGGKSSTERFLSTRSFRRGNTEGNRALARGVPPGSFCDEDCSWSTNAARAREVTEQLLVVAQVTGVLVGRALCRPSRSATAGAVANSNPVA